MCGKARVPGLTLKFGVVIFLRVFYDFAGIQGKQVSLPRKVIVLWGWGGGGRGIYLCLCLALLMRLVQRWSPALKTAVFFSTIFYDS